MMRQCVLEIGKQAQSMDLEDGYVSPSTSLSAPCQEYLWPNPQGD
jgi:hypothetical protein